MSLRPSTLRLFLILTLILPLTTGCVRRLIDFTIISSKDVAMTVPPSARGQERVRGTDHVYMILYIPLGTPDVKEAVDRAIESAGPGYDALVDGVIYSEFYWFLLGGRTGYRVVGTPINSAQVRTSLLDRPVLYHSSLGIPNDEAIARIGTRSAVPPSRAGDGSMDRAMP